MTHEECERALAQAQAKIAELKETLRIRDSVAEGYVEERDNLRAQLAATSQDILRAQGWRIALDELVSAIEDARRRDDAGDERALGSNMLRATLRQAKAALTEPGGQACYSPPQGT